MNHPSRPAPRPTPQPARPAAPAPGPYLELSGRVAALKVESRSVTRRNRVFLAGLAAGLVLLGLALNGLYQWRVRTYAVLDDVRIEQDPTSQGRVIVSFNVVKPGKVYYHRAGGAVEAEVEDVFTTPGRVSRRWAWGYEPGKPIDVTVKYRTGLWTGTQAQSFRTSNQADVVVLMDTTGTMGRYIHTLKQKCGPFAEKLRAQNVECRFALIGFGDAAEPAWLDKTDFTADVRQFEAAVNAVKRFDGGDFPESSLDALEEALQMPLRDGALRRFYLVTDDTFHDPARSKATAADLAARLAKANVRLTVFTVDEFAADFERLRGTSGADVTVLPLERFGAVLADGRILEDE